jgi:hypothetical protein
MKLPNLAYFWDRISLTFAWAGLELQSSHLHFLHSWENRYVFLALICFILKKQCWLSISEIVIWRSGSKSLVFISYF